MNEWMNEWQPRKASKNEIECKKFGKECWDGPTNWATNQPTNQPTNWTTNQPTIWRTKKCLNESCTTRLKIWQDLDLLIYIYTMLYVPVSFFSIFIFPVSFLVADTRLYTLPCRSVRWSVGRSIIHLNCERFLHYCSCPTVRDWIAVYPALFTAKLLGTIFFKQQKREILIWLWSLPNKSSFLGSGTKGPMSCRTQGWISRCPSVRMSPPGLLSGSKSALSGP